MHFISIKKAHAGLASAANTHTAARSGRSVAGMSRLHRSKGWPLGGRYVAVARIAHSMLTLGNYPDSVFFL